MKQTSSGLVQLEPPEVLAALLEGLTREAEAVAKDCAPQMAVQLLEQALRQLAGDSAVAQALTTQQARLLTELTGDSCPTRPSTAA